MGVSIESVAVALYSNLDSIRGVDGRPVDRLTALSLAKSRLGTSAIRLKYAKDETQRKPVLYLLHKECNKGIRRVKIDCCAQAIKEWMDDVCPVCKGEGEKVIEGIWIVCEECGGRGTNGHDDRKRAVSMGLPIATVERLAGKIGEAHAVLTRHVSWVMHEIREFLE